MYYIIYGFLYLLSLLPFFILYRISDLGYFVMYHLAGYRKKTVLENLAIAFPEKTIGERKEIARRFYKNLADTFIESIKLITLSEKEFLKRAELDTSTCLSLINKGLSIQFMCGHQMNWEYGNLVYSKKLPIPFVGIYLEIKNKAINRLFYEQRTKYGAVLFETNEFRTSMHQVFKKQYSIGLIADQNPGGPPWAYWLNFFNRPAPFLYGPDKTARRTKVAVVFTNLIKVRRGYYRFEDTIITENASSFKEGELTLLYRDFLEANIRKRPDNYLWSHRRWKWDYQPEYKKRWIDHVPAPE